MVAAAAAAVGGREASALAGERRGAGAPRGAARIRACSAGRGAGARGARARAAASGGGGGSERGERQEARPASQEEASLLASLADAEACLDAGVSPGAGLDTAEAQAEAAYADLILTGIQTREEELDGAELKELAARGGGMDGAPAKGGLWDLAKALVGGAHIVRRKDGSI